MQNFLLCLLFALINNLDNIGVRIAYSIKGVKISLVNNLWISVITFIISFGFAQFGSALGHWLNPRICGAVSMAVLCIVGIYIIWDAFRPKKSESAELGVPPAEAAKSMGFAEATALGVALSVNNAGGSLGGGLAGLNAWLIGGLSALLSFAALFSGNYLSELFRRFKLGRKAALVAGIALILLGVKQAVM